MEGLNPMQDPRHLGMMGKKAMQLGNYRDAVRMFSMGLTQVQFLSLPPHSAAPFLLDRAECFWRLGDVQASMQDMEDSLSHGLPRDDFFTEDESLKWTDHGNTLLQKNDFLSAEKCANFALFFQTSSKTRAQAFLCKAYALYEMGKMVSARREINEIKRLDSDLARNVAQERKDFAIALLKGKNYQGSIKHLNLALWLHPEDGSKQKFKRLVESHQAAAYFKLENYKKAVELGEESYKTNTSYRSKEEAERWKECGNQLHSFKETNLLDLVIACYTLALKFTPEHERDLRAAILSNRSLMHKNRGNTEEALKDARDCVDSKPEWFKAQYRLGSSLLAQKKYQEAMKPFSKSLQLLLRDSSSSESNKEETLTQLLSVALNRPDGTSSIQFKIPKNLIQNVINKAVADRDWKRLHLLFLGGGGAKRYKKGSGGLAMGCDASSVPLEKVICSDLPVLGKFINILLDHKANANPPKDRRKSPLDVAIELGKMDVASMLIDNRNVTSGAGAPTCTSKLPKAFARRKENEFHKGKCYFVIDDCNLPENCRLKLEKVQEGDRVVSRGKQTQYRLKPTEEFEPQGSFVSVSNPSYLEQLSHAVLVSLGMFKRERNTKNYLEPDMWCQLGRAIIRVPNEDNAAEGEWSIDEATGKFQSSAEGKYWKITFDEGVDLLEDIFKRNYREKISEEYTEYATRYDLTFQSPGYYQMQCKVWVAKKGTMKKLEDILIPSSDVKNILEEIHFENESTRLRCRGWLILPPRRYLRADILFPGCAFDCRFLVRGQTERAEAFDYVPKEEVRRVLSQYLSGLALTKDDAFGLRLPEKKIPKGFRLIHKRSSKRTAYTAKPGFSIILSKESSWRSVVAEERSRDSIDLHLHCDEWNQAFSSGQWEPEVIVEKLPEFLQFVKEVQGLVVREMQGDGPLKAPPEILARGQLALEAYNNALVEGNVRVKRVPLMLIGQDRSGKTSLKKSLKGIVFDPDEDSTVGIDVDRYHFEVTTETWMTGKKDEESTTDADAISFERNAARLVAERLMEVDNVIRSERAADGGSENYGPEITEIPIETELRESSSGPEPIYSQKPDPPAREVPNLTELSPEDDALVMTQVQMPDFEEISVITETLLKDGIEENSGDIHSVMWDFAGQSVYYATHPLFLTARAIYLLAYDLSQDPYDIARPVVKQGVYVEFQENFNQKTNLDYLDFWLASVASLASQDKHNDIDLESEVLPKQLPAVFLVCTHADQPHNGYDPFKLAREIFGTLKSKPYGAQLFDVFVVDNTKSGSGSECPEVMRLREVVLAAAKELPHVNEVIPIKWLKYEKALEMLKNNGHKWISLAQAKHVMSKVCSINSDDEMLTLLNFLHDLRLLIHFDDTKELNDVVVLDPQWLIDVFKEVITVRAYSSKDKRFVDLWRKLERYGILEEKLLKHVWSSLITRRETFECLIAIMVKFSLLCPLPFHVDGSSSKQYLVPSMLKSHPPNAISDLVASAQIPSLFLRFETGQVPAGYFPRLVLEFFQWFTDKFPRQEPPQLPQLFDSFARFYILPQEGRSVVLLCRSLSIELLLLTSNETLDTSDENLACVIRNKLASMIECMQSKFFWVKNVVCALNFLCPVCCRGREVSYCRTHHAEGCKQEECLHFFPASKLATGDKQVFCDRSATAQENRVSVTHFAPWFPCEHDQQELSSDEHDGRLFTSVPDELPERSLAMPCNVLESLQPVNQLEAGIADESAGELLPFLPGHCDTSLAFPCEVLTTLQTQFSTPENVVDKFLQNMQLEHASLKQSEPETRKLIRCFARNANNSNRLDVLKHLRQITPAGTTGPLLSETLAIRDIPLSQIRKITVPLSGGEEWKLVAEKFGFTPDEIRLLDRRSLNPAEKMLEYIAYKYPHVTAGQLYDVLTACGVPVLADLL